MEREESNYAISDNELHSNSNKLARLRTVAVKRVGKPQIFKRRPIVMNDHGIVWQADIGKFCYRDESNGKRYSCSWSIEGGVVIVRDHLHDVVEAYKLRDGETVETVY